MKYVIFSSCLKNLLPWIVVGTLSRMLAKSKPYNDFPLVVK